MHCFNRNRPGHSMVTSGRYVVVTEKWRQSAHNVLTHNGFICTSYSNDYTVSLFVYKFT